jgi:beta-glucosidase
MLDKGLTVYTTVENTGERAGEEVVQLYLRDMVASEAQPKKRLVGFLRVPLEPGETRRVAFHLTAKDLQFFSQSKNKRVLEPGEFKVWIGSSSRDEDSTSASFELLEESRSNGRWWEARLERRGRAP